MEPKCFFLLRTKKNSEESKAVVLMFLVHSGLQGPCSYLILLTVDQKHEHKCESEMNNFNTRDVSYDYEGTFRKIFRFY